VSRAGTVGGARVSCRQAEQGRLGRRAEADADQAASGAGDGQCAAAGEEGQRHARDDRQRHAHALADLLVGEAFELAQDEDLVVALRQAPEGAAQVVELQPALDLQVGRRGQRQRAAIGVRHPPSSVSSGTSSARRERRKWSMQAFLAIS
jgi:predicted urease superfamily metal-dependent hydrolase